MTVRRASVTLALLVVLKHWLLSHLSISQCLVMANFPAINSALWQITVFTPCALQLETISLLGTFGNRFSIGNELGIHAACFTARKLIYMYMCRTVEPAKRAEDQSQVVSLPHGLPARSPKLKTGEKNHLLLYTYIHTVYRLETSATLYTYSG